MNPYEPKQRTGTVVRRDGREPLGLGSPVGVQAVAFDADTGRLDVAPAAPAYGTKLRWSGPKLLAAANKKVFEANVRTLHALALCIREGRPRHGGRRPEPAAAGGARRAGAATPGRLTPRHRSAPPGRPALRG
ncbi:hypothetical protein GCM10010304_81950 [Streptomyces roseoviolaceus]